MPRTTLHEREGEVARTSGRLTIVDRKSAQVQLESPPMADVRTTERSGAAGGPTRPLGAGARTCRRSACRARRQILAPPESYTRRQQVSSCAT